MSHSGVGSVTEHTVLWARDVLGEVTRLRGARRQPGQSAFSNWYTAFVGLAVLGSMIGSGVVGVRGPGGCVGSDCTSTAPGWPVVLGVGVTLVGALAWVAGLCGPLGAGAERRTWLLSTPADRGTLLAGRWRGTVAVSALLGALCGVLLGVLGAGAHVELLLACGSLGVTLAVGITLLLSLAQLSAGRIVRQLQRVGLVLVALGSLTTLLGALDVAPLGALPVAPFEAYGAVLLGLASVALAAVDLAGLRLVRRRLGELTLIEATRGGEVIDAARDSSLSMDLTSLSLLQARRALATGGSYRSRPGRGTGLSALAHRDLLRVARKPGAVLAPWTALPLVLAAGRLQQGWALVLATIAVVLSARSASRGLAAWSGSAGLQRLFPSARAQTRAALLVAPAAASVALGAAAVAVAGLPAWQVLALTAAGVSSALSAARPRPQVVGVVIATPAGALPLGMIQRLLRGVDVAAFCVLPVLASGSPAALVVPLGVVTYAFHRADRP